LVTAANFCIQELDCGSDLDFTGESGTATLRTRCVLISMVNAAYDSTARSHPHANTRRLRLVLGAVFVFVWSVCYVLVKLLVLRLETVLRPLMSTVLALVRVTKIINLDN